MNATSCASWEKPLALNVQIADFTSDGDTSAKRNRLQLSVSPTEKERRDVCPPFSPLTSATERVFRSDSPSGSNSAHICVLSQMSGCTCRAAMMRSRKVLSTEPDLRRGRGNPGEVFHAPSRSLECQVYTAVARHSRQPRLLDRLDHLVDLMIGVIFRSAQRRRPRRSSR